MKFPKTFRAADFRVILLSTAAIAALGYLAFRRKRKSRAQLENELATAQQTVRELEDMIVALGQQNCQKESQSREIRIWMDGAFDMMHYGHMNAFRQGRALGTKLIVGVNSDESITACKGKPVNTDSERIKTVEGCRWVDEVVTDVPYIMNEDYLAYVIEKYRIDYVVHGDDPCIVDGKDVYETARKLGKYLTIPRTEGISTTDIVGRMLLMTRSHHSVEELSSNTAVSSASGLDFAVDANANSDESSAVNCAVSIPLNAEGVISSGNEGNEAIQPQLQQHSYNGVADDVKSNTLAGGAVDKAFARKSNFLTTSRTIRMFGAGVRAPERSEKVVYLAGAWDMFHAGHVTILEEARRLGDYVIVGVHSDGVVNRLRGINLPIMNLHERVLSVLGCKWVDDVLIDAPYVVTKDMISSLRIQAVVRGAVESGRGVGASAGVVLIEGSEPQLPPPGCPGLDPYSVPRAMGILHTVKCKSSISAKEIVDRIQEQREKFLAKFSRKRQEEDDYYALKYGNVL